ncbi:predicted protein [Uncinocarpus reesii 1704]|uniref:DUF3431 domain-containing protein n=1 Tax=Uncinocarpus reesii (strain UAMH 1704) TaxID=336963 RepID=C4JSR8_UNCRE|nr:uncharacterized protein UREG_05507 [Uncinocarpus reesii 1704]EEP80665.1 predicted protein [Uncinocarpus reesii 1704]
MFRRFTNRRWLFAIFMLALLSLFTVYFPQLDSININTSEEADQPAHSNAINGATSPSSSRSPTRPLQSAHAISGYTRTIVVAKLKAEDTTWVDSLVKSDRSITPAVYVVDDPQADLFVIKNKGHELMPYLTYIIDNYENLPNVTIFMHAHNATWHNNDFFNLSSETMVSQLKIEHVIREGYMNLRCKHEPGCPNHIHPTVEDEGDIRAIPEAAVFGRAWKELFPTEPVPVALAQPCCSQFAVSSERIRAIPLPQYVFWRDWVLRTTLPDRLTGRVWEYLWQYIFTGKAVVCPDERICACQGYGICSRENV